jgi:hypothetical protein
MNKIILEMSEERSTTKTYNTPLPISGREVGRGSAIAPHLLPPRHLRLVAGLKAPG